MATLTETAYYTRKGIVWLGISTVVFFLLRFLFYLLLPIIVPPPPPPAPTVDFGKLPGIIFPRSDSSSSISFQLELKEGKLPQSSDSARVYFIPRKLPNLLAVERAKKFALELGFKQEPVQKTSSVFKFSDADYPRILLLDTVTNNFILQYDYVSDPKVISANPRSIDKAKDEARKFFKGLQILPSTIDEKLTRTELLQQQGTALVEATSLSTTQAIRVDFFHKALDNLPIVAPHFIHSQIYAIYTGNKNESMKIVKAEYRYYPADTTTSGTYPIKTTQQAWEELQNGFGYVANKGKVTRKAIIRQAYLAYYNPPEYQPYLQPVFVFEGDFDFAAFVPAVSSELSDPPQKAIQSPLEQQVLPR